MESVQTLIDRALVQFGTPYKLAKAAGCSQGNLSEMHHGKRPMAPRIAGRIAELIGDDPREAALMALVEQEKDEDKRADLLRMFRLRIS